MSSKLIQILVTVLFGTISCIIIGVLIYGFAIFKMNDMRFVIVLYGLYGSIFFGGLKYLKNREQIASIIFVVLLSILVRGRTIHPLYYLEDVYLLVPLYISLFLYKLFSEKYSSIPFFVRGLSLVLIYPIFYLISFFPLFLILGVDIKSALSSLFIDFRLSIIVSVGLAIGFDLYENYKIKINSYLEVV